MACLPVFGSCRPSWPRSPMRARVSSATCRERIRSRWPADEDDVRAPPAAPGALLARSRRSVREVSARLAPLLASRACEGALTQATNHHSANADAAAGKPVLALVHIPRTGGGMLSTAIARNSALQKSAGNSAARSFGCSRRSELQIAFRFMSERSRPRLSSCLSISTWLGRHGEIAERVRLRGERRVAGTVCAEVDPLQRLRGARLGAV